MTLLRGAGFSSVMLCAGTAVGVAVQWLLARTLGVREYSYYTYASAWLSVLALVSRLGYDQSLVRFLPAYRAKGEWQHLRLDPTLLGRCVTSPPQPRDVNPLLAISGASPCPDQTF